MLRLRYALRQHECERGTDLSILTVTGTEADAAPISCGVTPIPRYLWRAGTLPPHPLAADSLLRMFGMSRK